MDIDGIADMEFGEFIRFQMIFLEIIDLVRHLLLPESLHVGLHLDFCPENPHRLRDFQSFRWPLHDAPDLAARSFRVATSRWLRGHR